MRAQLDEGVRRGALQGDPYGELVGAMGEGFDLLAQHAQLGEAQRHPLTVPERQELVADVVGAVARGMRQEVGGIRAAVSRKALATLVLGMAALALSSGVTGYVVGRTATQDEVVVVQAGLRMDLEAARAWLDIIRANPDPRPAWQRAAIRADASGRHYREGISLWNEMPPPVPTGR